MFDESANSKSYVITLSILGLLLALAMATALIPSWRDRAQKVLWPVDRLILAKSQGPLEPGGAIITALKIKTKDALFLEIFKGATEDSTPEFLARFPLEGSQDGYFTYHGEAANLVISDTDGDGYVDVIVPTFDSNQQARLNVFKYDAKLEIFVKMEPSTGP